MSRLSNILEMKANLHVTSLSVLLDLINHYQADKLYLKSITENDASIEPHWINLIYKGKYDDLLDITDEYNIIKLISILVVNQYGVINNDEI